MQVLSKMEKISESFIGSPVTLYRQGYQTALTLNPMHFYALTFNISCCFFLFAGCNLKEFFTFLISASEGSSANL